VVAVGSALPDASVATADIEDRLGLEPGWLVRRTGVVSRHRALPEDDLGELGGKAALQALDRATTRPEAVDLVLAATMTPREGEPSLAGAVAKRIGAARADALDVSAACSGFVYALALATGCVEAGRARQVVVVGGDLMSRLVDHDDRVTAGIFGDGAGAVVVRAVDGLSAVGPYVLGADGGHADAIVAAHPSGPVRMDGRRVFRLAVDRLVETSNEAVRRAGITLDDVDLVVPHQANARITRAIRDRLGLKSERVVDCIARYGNTTGGTLPIALSHAHADGRLRFGSRVLLVAFGAGLAWGAVVLTWGGACRGSSP
jgi:3-oxoacyl-[acyl-carrier-protein] synthase-3